MEGDCEVVERAPRLGGNAKWTIEGSTVRRGGGCLETGCQ